MDKIFQRLIASNFSEFPGLTVDAFIPVPEALVNEILQAVLQGNKDITSCHVTIKGDNRVLVNLKIPKWPWPLNLKLRLFGSVDFTHSPKIRAFLENNILLGKLGSLFKALPEGITLYDDQVAVDIESFLPPEQKQLLTLVKSVDIRTAENKVIMDVSVKVH